jgi:hypothetical protein
MNNCNNHGTCDEANRVCRCFDGFGSASDIAQYKAPDCSLSECRAILAIRATAVLTLWLAGTCPSDKAWVDIPSGSTTAHALAECSNAGLCDRNTGRCRCFAGFEGDACQRGERAREDAVAAACPPCLLKSQHLAQTAALVTESAFP